MGDYGHELAFGTFITPQNQQPDDVVALARLTERAGLDLASFQDHPYQPAFLDTWTLLSWVAAQTETVRVSPNVLNLPLRQPAVVARAAASLDLLSGGRLELGLGAGAFWDGIAAMGGRRLTPGQAVDALSEAIDVIRAIWDTSERGGVRVDGEYYDVRGAKRGPEPAHDIPIWLGAYKPRMLRLTGRKADGWLPSLAYLSPEELGPANRTIDEAASAGGRDPGEVRRLLNVQGAFAPSSQGFLQGPPEQWVEELLALVVEHGFSTFIITGDDARTIEVFGQEVAPALREAVSQERRAAGTQSGAVARGPRAIALRREGIDYDGLPASLRSQAIEPGDRAYPKVRSTYIRRGSPGLVFQPDGVDEVVDALGFAREQGVPLAIRSGGHGISGRSTNDGGIVVDVGALDEIDLIDPAEGRIRLGPGARWGEVAQALAPHGLAMSSGDYGDVGVGGLATAGGIGFLVRKYGLTIDHVVAAELVLADGTFVRADADNHSDLLWAVRGAGGNFGIVTAVELDAYEVRDVVFSAMAFEASPEFLERWGGAVEAAPRELTSFLSVFAEGGVPIAQLYNVFAGDDKAAAADTLSPLRGIGPMQEQQPQLVPYRAIVPPHGGVHSGGRVAPAVRSGLLDHLTPRAARSLIGLLPAGDAQMMQVRSVGGAVNDVDPAATAYAHRTQNFAANAVGVRFDRLDERWDAEVSPHVDGVYSSFDTDQRPERLHDAFPGETLAKLRRLKALYDPDNVFNQNFPIPPAERGRLRPEAVASTPAG
jgi:alkanesulfonate monooxygenase SsuD/methylene tetrahydromethanopterin reductase-like flavin-dependent oxidoreductase (luciferase family)/FAD/FMN-containing dehydrogenase